MSFTTQLLEGLKATTAIEWIAVSSSIIYVVLAAKRFVIVGFCFYSFGTFVYLCYVGKLYIEALFNFYVVMALVAGSRKHSSIFLIKTWTTNLHVKYTSQQFMLSLLVFCLIILHNGPHLMLMHLPPASASALCN